MVKLNQKPPVFANGTTSLDTYKMLSGLGMSVTPDTERKTHCNIVKLHIFQNLNNFTILRNRLLEPRSIRREIQESGGACVEWQTDIPRSSPVISHTVWNLGARIAVCNAGGLIQDGE